jgi:dihydroneopterin aldolase
MELMDAGDRIHIDGLELMARVGVPDEERARPQRVVFNLTLWPTTPMASLQDDLARSVDYAAVCSETKRFVEKRCDRLIETLADAVANRLLEVFAITKISIELRKFILPEVQFVSVTLVRERR